MLARLGRGYASGQSFEQIARDFRVVPPGLADLDARWLGWLEAQRLPDGKR